MWHDEKVSLVWIVLNFQEATSLRSSMKSIMRKEEQATTPHVAMGKRLAQVLSEIFNPLFVALPTLLGIARVSAPDLPHALLWWVVAVLGVSIAPTLFVLRGVRSGRYTDHHVSVREQRLVPLLFGAACVVITFILLLALHASRPLIATMTAVIVVLLLATLITRFWKISLHLVGITGAVTAYTLLFGPLFLFLSPLVLLVGWARWRVGAHTPWQAAAGVALAVSLTTGIFWLWRIVP